MGLKDLFKHNSTRGHDKESIPKTGDADEVDGGVWAALPIAPQDPATRKWLESLSRRVLAGEEGLKLRMRDGTTRNAAELRDFIYEWGLNHGSFKEVYKFLNEGKACPFDAEQTLEMLQVFVTLLSIIGVVAELRAEDKGSLRETEVQELIKKHGVN